MAEQHEKKLEADQLSKNIRIMPPNVFSFVPEEWPKYKTRFIRYMNLSGNDKNADKDKIDCLLYCMGDKVEDIVLQFGSTTTYEKLLGQFDNFFSPKKNTVFERYKFNTYMQKEEESFDEFLVQIYKLAEHCEFLNLKEELLRDKIILGIKDKQVSDRLLLQNNLTLEEAIVLCKQAEMQCKESKLMRGDTILEVNRIRNQEKRQQSKCWFCGLERHSRLQCPARGATCHKCQRLGHFAKLCRSKSVKLIQEETSGKELEVRLCQQGKETFMIPITIYHCNSLVNKIKFLIDTGADITAIPENTSQGLPVVKCKDIVKGPDGTQLKVTGTITLKLIYKDRSYFGKVYVIKELTTAILGRSAIKCMKVLSICSVIQSDYGEDCKKKSREEICVEKEFPNIFDELGVFKDEFHIQLVDCPKPFIQASPRSVSIPLLPKVKSELDRLENLGIITPVEEPTDFVSPIVVVLKNEKVRICGDYTQLNRNVARPVYPIPKVENTLARLKGSKYFSKIDATSGFHQIKLDDASKKLTTIITPFGRYMYNRLPFGLNCAPEYFSMKFTNLFKDLKVLIHIDDILIYEACKEDHDRVLREVLKRLQKEGITINKNKCVFGVPVVSYLGHIISEKGISVDPVRIKAIKEFKTPTNKKELLQFLGMVNFVGRFVPNRSHLLEPLHALLKEDNIYLWGPSQEQAFLAVKNMLQESPTLAHYDPNSKIIVSADSSSYGLGAALMQENKLGHRSIVMYASRTLTKSEKHYAQIEKECLALTWAAEKFRDYIVGLHIWLETDHKPLIQILQTKPLDDLSPRLLRFRLRLMRFDYEVIYTPGKDLAVADALSRQPSEETSHIEDTPLSINMFVSEAVPNELLLKIKSEQESSNVCNTLKVFTIQGWPAKNKLGEFKYYYQYKENFSVESDLLLYNSRIVIPESMQKDILNKIHEGHLGISKCRERAKQTVWWLGISKHIENIVKTCPKCIEVYKNKKEEMVIDPIPDRPWQKIGLDLFKYNNSWYLVMIDYFSRFLEIFKLRDLTEKTVIIQCKSVFSRYGIPEVVRSDCGSQFKSQFISFSEEYGFRLVTSSPYYPQSNGLAESGVKIAKSLLGKNNDIYLALLIYRNTPLESGYSPAELMFNRKLRDILPMIPSKLNKPVVIGKEIKDCRMRKKYKDAYYYNNRHRTTTALPQLNINDRVWVTDLKTYGTVLEKCSEPRSFIINTDNGKFKRNRWHLNLVPNNISPLEDSKTSYCNNEITDVCTLGPSVNLSGPEITQSSSNQESSSMIHEQNTPSLSTSELTDKRPERSTRRPKYLDDYVTT